MHIYVKQENTISVQKLEPLFFTVTQSALKGIPWWLFSLHMDSSVFQLLKTCWFWIVDDEADLVYVSNLFFIVFCDTVVTIFVL